MALEVRIGVNPVSSTNDDLPSLGGETPLEAALLAGSGASAMMYGEVQDAIQGDPGEAA